MTANIMSVEQAAEVLQMDAGRLTTWLRGRGLLRTIAGVERVSLRAIEAVFELEFEREDDGLVSTEDAAKLLGTSRATLDRLAGTAPPNIPGGPVNIGTGKRQHFRWDPRTVAAWVAAARVAKSAPRPRSAPRRRPTPGDDRPVDWAKTRVSLE